VRKLRHDDSDKDQLFRRRTAEQILASGFATGCTDYALAALPLLRRKGVPAVYVEAFRKDWLDGEAPFGGHVFVEAFVDGRWIILNPAAGVEAPRYDEHVVVARGADSWDIGLKNAADVDAAARLALERHRRDR
jgi:transglutaminase-like putative cysteine protease